jgi:hypothetical protein
MMKMAAALKIAAKKTQNVIDAYHHEHRAYTLRMDGLIQMLAKGQINDKEFKQQVILAFLEFKKQTIDGTSISP